MKKLAIIGWAVAVVFGVSASILFYQNQSLREDAKAETKVTSDSSSSSYDMKVSSNSTTDSSEQENVWEYDLEETGRELIEKFVRGLYSSDTAERNSAMKAVGTDAIIKQYSLPDDFDISEVPGNRAVIGKQLVYYKSINESEIVLLDYFEMMFNDLPEKMLAKATIIDDDGTYKISEANFESINGVTEN